VAWHVGRTCWAMSSGRNALRPPRGATADATSRDTRSVVVCLPLLLLSECENIFRPAAPTFVWAAGRKMSEALLLVNGAQQQPA